MEETLEVIMSNVKEHFKHNSTGKQLGYTPSGAIWTHRLPTRNSTLSDCRQDMDMATCMTPTDYDRSGMITQTEYKVAEVLWQVCPVVLFLFGTVGNILILLMLRSLRLGRTSMHIYLRALAISDLCVLYTGLLRQWIHWSFGIDLRDQHTLICKAHIWMVYVSLYVSTWLLVFMTLERACSACLPHRVNTFCTKRRACFLILFIVVFHSCMQSHFLFGMAVSDDKNQTQSCKALTKEYFFFIHDVLPLVDLVLLSLLPCIFVIIGNVIIVWKTFLSLRTAAELNLASGSSAVMRRRRASSMTIILLCLSALFLLTTSPTCVYNMWERGGAAKEASKTPEGAARVELAWACVNIVMYCNNTFNFYLYCLSGRKFRNEMIRQFSRRRTDSQSMVLSAPSLQVPRFQLNGFQHNGPMIHQSSFYGRNSSAYL